jgi:hypothetical protein
METIIPSSESRSSHLPVEDDKLRAQESVLEDEVSFAACDVEGYIHKRATVVWLDPSSKTARDGQEQRDEHHRCQIVERMSVFGQHTLTDQVSYHLGIWLVT